MTSLSLRTVQEMAAAGKISSAAKLGGVWTFDPVAIQNWIEEQRREVIRQAQASNAALVEIGNPKSSPSQQRLRDDKVQRRYMEIVFPNKAAKKAPNRVRDRR